VRSRLLLAAALAALAAPAAAYLLPGTAVLKRVSQKREAQALASLEVQGTLSFLGEAAAQAGGMGLTGAGQEASAPALLTVKVPGKCRVDLLLPDVPAAERPAAATRGARLSGTRGLERQPGVVALVQGLCALLGERPGGVEPERPWVQALAPLGVAIEEVSLARAGSRVAYVLGGKAREERPLAWVDKQSFQPLRLAAAFGGTRQEVRLIDWGSSTGGDLFPRAVEVWVAGQARLRFTTEKVVSNPKVADALFP
jgi:hypothetical protein